MLYLDLLQNVALLVALAAALQMLGRNLEHYPRSYRWASALLFGLAGIVGMMTPVHFSPGVIYDGRSIVLSLAGLFCGPAAIAPAGMCGAYRLYLGGAGAPVGVSVVVEATVLGIGLHYLRKGDERWVSTPRLLAFGLLVHLGMIGLQLFIPGIDTLRLLTRIAPGVLLFFPLAFWLTAQFFLTSEVRRTTEKALHDKEERLKLSIEGGELGTWDWNIVTGANLFNSHWAEMLGYREEEIGPHIRIWEGLIHPEDQPRVQTILQAHLDGLTPSYEAELRLRHKSGSWIWVLSKGRVIERDARGNPLRACGTHLDITTRKAAEEALRLSEARNQAILSAMPDLLFRLDKSCRFIDYSASNPALLARPPEEFLGKNVNEVLPASLAGKTQELLTRTLETEQLQTYDYTLEIAGEMRFFEARMAVCGPDEVLVMTRDVTERKRNEAERERLGVAIEQAAEAIVITDPDAVMEYVNPAFERATGFTREEAIGQHTRILKSGAQDEAFYANMWETISNGRLWQGIMVNRRKDGSLYTEEASIAPVVSASGDIVNYVAVKRDITHRLELEEQLLQAQKMESVGRLAGGIAHDFNNMLNVILGCTDLIMEDVGPDHPNYADLHEIKDAAERSAALTRQLLAYARKQPIAPELMDLTEVVTDLLKMLRRLIGEDIAIEFNPGPGTHPVTMDPAQLGQLLANLAVNARDAIAGVGTIIIDTGHATLDDAWCAQRPGLKPGRYATLTVRDTGAGMDKETLAKVFDPFFTTKPVGQGTGLGLATVYGIVKQNDGYIEVESTPGEGTTFRLYFPSASPREAGGENTAAAEPPATNAGTAHVLLAEDDEALLRLTQRLLEKQGYHVLAANSPNEAIRLAREHPTEIHLLLTDVIMPEMSGRDLHHVIAQLRPGIKCIYMSGYTAEIIAHHGILEEGINFIQKPFEVAELFACVSRVLGDQGGA